MTRRNIILGIARELKRTQSETKQIVRLTLDAIIRALGEEGHVELRNFGVFYVKKRKARTGRNPRTGETVMIGERTTITFKPGRVLKQRVADR